ncbi:MAG: hypothetical protein ABTQ28_02180, partial [Thauera sp.]
PAPAPPMAGASRPPGQAPAYVMGSGWRSRGNPVATGGCRFSFTISLRGFHMISARYLRKWRGFLLCDFNFIMDFNRF